MMKESSDLKTRLDDIAQAKSELPVYQRHMELLDNPRKYRSEPPTAKRANSTKG